MENMSNLNDDHLWQSFSDQLRLHTPSLAPSDSIWNDSFLSSRRNYDTPRKNLNTPHLDQQTAKPSTADLNSSFGWKTESKIAGTRVGYFNKELPKPAMGKNLNYNEDFGGKGAALGGKKKSNNVNSSNGEKGGGVEKRFKTLPAAEALPRSEAVGGYIFVCNNDTMPENLQRMLFGLPPRYRDSVRAITPGLPLFLYNYSTHQLHGIYQAASFGGTNIDPSAWEDKKCPGESRFPAQVRATTRRIYEPLEEEDFRPILHHYDGPKFRLELNVPEALALLDKFEEKMSW